MNIKSLKTLLAISLAFGLTLPAFAEDADDYDSSDSKYELAYNKCSDVADTQETYDNWDDTFNSCMKTEGYETEAESNEDADSYQ